MCRVCMLIRKKLLVLGDYYESLNRILINCKILVISVSCKNKNLHVRWMISGYNNNKTFVMK